MSFTRKVHVGHAPTRANLRTVTDVAHAVDLATLGSHTSSAITDLAAAVDAIYTVRATARALTEAAAAVDVSRLIFGTLATVSASASTESAAGVQRGMIQLQWRSAETAQGTFSSGYVTTVQGEITALQNAGMQITLDLGLQFPPSWAVALNPYVGSNGAASSTRVNTHFSAALRSAAATYFAWINTTFGLNTFSAIRIPTGGDNGECLYPPNDAGTDDYMCFDSCAWTGVGLAAGQTQNPLATSSQPNWRPGNGATNAPTQTELQTFLDWYCQSNINTAVWVVESLNGLGYLFDFETLTPGVGSRPNNRAGQLAAYLPPGNLLCTGSEWRCFYLGNVTGYYTGVISGLQQLTQLDGLYPRIVAYVSSLGDQSGLGGVDDVPLPLDATTYGANPSASNPMNNWSSGRLINFYADLAGFRIGGENRGYNGSGDTHYTDTSPNGLMAKSIAQAVAGRFCRFYWAQDTNIQTGGAIIAFSVYAAAVAATAATGAQRLTMLKSRALTDGAGGADTNVRRIIAGRIAGDTAAAVDAAAASAAPAFGSYDPTPALTGPNGTYSAYKISSPLNTTWANQLVTLGTTTGFTTPGTYTGYEFGRVVMSPTATGTWILQSCFATGISGESLSGDVALFMHDDTGTAASLQLIDCSACVSAGNENLYLNCIMGHDITTKRCYATGGCDIVDARNSHNSGGAVNFTDYGSYWGQYAGFLVDPEHGNGPSHNDCIQIFGGSNVHLYGTHLDGFVSPALGDGAKWAGNTTYSSNGGLNGNSCIQTNVATGDISNVGFHDIFVSGGSIPVNFNNANSGPYVNSTMNFTELTGTYQKNTNSGTSLVVQAPFQSGSGGTYITTYGPNLYPDGTTIKVYQNPAP